MQGGYSCGSRVPKNSLGAASWWAFNASPKKGADSDQSQIKCKWTSFSSSFFLSLSLSLSYQTWYQRHEEHEQTCLYTQNVIPVGYITRNLTSWTQKEIYLQRWEEEISWMNDSALLFVMRVHDDDHITHSILGWLIKETFIHSERL